jgi:hypothetical protein
VNDKKERGRGIKSFSVKQNAHIRQASVHAKLKLCKDGMLHRMLKKRIC